MKKKYLISVCIPVYNCEKYIREAIDSILGQTYANYELIIVDDCSTDRTGKIVKTYADKDERIIYYKNKDNLGMAKNWNKSILLTKGEYIKILCADDTIEPEFLQNFAEILDKHPNVSLVTSYERFIGDRNDVRKIPSIPLIGELNGKLAQKHLMMFGNWVGCPTAVMFRKKDLYTGLFNASWGWLPDLDMWIRLLGNGNLYVIPKILSHSRVHNLQATAVNIQNFISFKEEILFQKVVFKYPISYGSYTKKERKIILNKFLNRLLKKRGQKKKLRPMLTAVKLGIACDMVLFFKLIVKKIIYKFEHPMKQLLRRACVDIPNNIIWRKKFGYIKIQKSIDIVWKKIDITGSMMTPMDMLYAKIFTPTGFKIVPIDETPHYQWIKNLIENTDDAQSHAKYYKYVKTFFPEENTSSQLDKIKKMALSFKTQNNTGCSIITHMPIRDKNHNYKILIYDGVHRTSIMKALKRKSVNCLVVKGNYATNIMPDDILNG